MAPKVDLRSPNVHSCTSVHESMHSHTLMNMDSLKHVCVRTCEPARMHEHTFMNVHRQVNTLAHTYLHSDTRFSYVPVL